MEAPLFTLIGFILLAIETFVGMVGNGFIVLTNCIDWFKSWKLSPADLILTWLGLSRLVWLMVVILEETLHFFYPSDHIWNVMYLLLPIVWIFTNTASIWIATWLSVFYFAKISMFSHPIFLQMKQRISRLIPWLLLGSIIFSAIMTIIVLASLNNDLSRCNPYKSFLSTNDSKTKTVDSCRSMDILATAPNSIPFLIFLSSSILLITSMWKHTRHMQHNGTGVKDFNTQVHLTAIKVLVSFIVLYLFGFLAITLQAILTLSNKKHTWPSMLLNNMSAICRSGHAIILIRINPKLKQAWVRMLHHFKCHLSGAQS